MDKQQEVARINNGIKVLLWLGFLAFFVYSFQTIMNFEETAHPRRQESFIRILTALSKPNFFEGEASRQVAVEMWETIQIAFLATTISAVFAIPLTFFSTRASSFWGRGFNILLQPILSAIRAVHPLIITSLTIVIAGIGPTAGVLALILFSTAVLIENYSEYVQQHMSLSWTILFKVHFPGLAFKHFSVNILIATVLGFMGGGGIGWFLQTNISLLNYRDAGAAIWACIITIGSLDLLGRVIWHKIQNQNQSVFLPPTSEIADIH